MRTEPDHDQQHGHDQREREPEPCAPSFLRRPNRKREPALERVTLVQGSGSILSQLAGES